CRTHLFSLGGHENDFPLALSDKILCCDTRRFESAEDVYIVQSPDILHRHLPYRAALIDRRIGHEYIIFIILHGFPVGRICNIHLENLQVYTRLPGCILSSSAWDSFSTEAMTLCPSFASPIAAPLARPEPAPVIMMVLAIFNFPLHKFSR